MNKNNEIESTGSENKWQFWVDRGGTFTDVVAKRPDGSLVTHKLLSENSEHYEDAAVQAIRDLLGLSVDEIIPSGRMAAVKMGTTVATNALLERKGERTLLVVTKGFSDALRIGYQARPRLFDRRIVLPEQLYSKVVEVEERIGANGDIHQALNLEAAREDLQAAYDDDYRSVAIVFMHAYRYPAHERAVAAVAREIGFEQISTGFETSPLMKLVGRGDTTVVDAYLSPILRRYVNHVAEELGDANLLFMQSNGGLVDATIFQGKDAILSGPAGGIVGAVQVSKDAGFEKLITFDMGGTSTDVAHYDGEYERAFETLVAGVRMRAPMMQIHTVAAGGGSMCFFDGARYRVGPESAGANPGPASYRRGGPLCVTDCNVILGKLQPNYFPAVFGLGQDEPLDVAVVQEKFAAMAKEIKDSTGDARSPVEVADGFLTIAVENMANAIKKISVQRGYDVTDYTLCCFGGAGGQHACLVADALGMKKILIHPFAGVLSAYGMGLADLRALREKAVEAPLEDVASGLLDKVLDELMAEAVAEIRSQKIPDSRISMLRKAHLKYDGTDTALAVDAGPAGAMKAAFEAAYQQRYGFIMPDKAVVVEVATVEAIGRADDVASGVVTTVTAAGGAIGTLGGVDAYMAGEMRRTPIYDRAALPAGAKVDGPAIICEDTATSVIEPGWQAEMTTSGDLVMSRVVALPTRMAIGTTCDPVMLEVFNNLFMSIAEQMGFTLQNTAYSVNIKERLDFSCAVFAADGGLIANAPHIPIHLGSMGQSVRTVIDKNQGRIKPGDVFVLNDPYNGGTHLPDVTVITPVFGGGEKSNEILFYVGSRGHHADIGGITPGSMPPDSKVVEEEGVLLDNVKLVEGGRFQEASILELLTSAQYPARNTDQNLADLRAQVAANERGVQELRKMVDHYGLDVVHAYMVHVQDNAEESVRRVIDVLRDGEFTYPMDEGSVVKVKITFDKAARGATLDFTGTSAQRPTNFNAPTAVVRAAALYVFRTLVDDDIPMNDGCLKPITFIVPEGSMLAPSYPAPVVAGNVETSQCVTDALYGALGVMAASQGTMNNLTFGNDQHQYYETVCGGSGAGPGWDGTSAVHTNMTNSRLTDPEVLEWRYPVLLESFGVRHGSGGAGQYRGGDGTYRRIRFLENMEVVMLSNHRIVPPYGMAGGEPGQCGKNWVERKNGDIHVMTGLDTAKVAVGDVFILETPTGGGYGPKLA